MSDIRDNRTDDRTEQSRSFTNGDMMRRCFSVFPGRLVLHSINY